MEHAGMKKPAPHRVVKEGVLPYQDVNSSLKSSSFISVNSTCFASEDTKLKRAYESAVSHNVVIVAGSLLNLMFPTLTSEMLAEF